MKRIFHSLVLTLSGCLALGSLHGQFTYEGTDDFNDGVPALGSGLRWAGVFGSNIGTVAWTETNQRLEFTGSHGTASPSFSQYGWNSGADVALFDDTSWTASIELSVPHVPTSGFVQGALITSLVGGGRSYGLYLYSGVEETKLTSVYTISSTITVVDTDFISDVTDVELRLQWDATARTLTSSYRFSPLDAYTTSATLDVVGTLGFDPTGGFYINPSARAALGESVASGGLYFDNMSVTAIPEPSTYAALAGLTALGLTFWRRRRHHLVAMPLLAGLAVSASSSSAQIVTINVTGTIAQHTAQSFTNASSLIPDGSSFTASWQFDSSALTTSLATSYPSGSVVRYEFSGLTASFTSSSYTFTGNTYIAGRGLTSHNDVTYLTGAGADALAISSGPGGTAQNGYTTEFINLQLISSNTFLFPSNSLSNFQAGASFLPQAYSANNLFTLRVNDGANLYTEMTGSISSYTYSVTSIPEPSTYAALAGFGALGLACWRRRAAWAA